MNMLAEGGVNALGVSPALVRDAQKEAAKSARPVVVALEEMAGLSPHDFTLALAMTLGLRALSMQDLNALQPDFSILPFAEAVSHDCLALRDADGALLLAISDPFDADLDAWAIERVGRAFRAVLVHRTDLSALHTRLEEGLQAMASIGEVLDPQQLLEGGENLSLKSISEHASPVIRLVDSTLYDALKAGASDIHLESHGQGLTIKYRVDGVLTPAGQANGVQLAEHVISRVKVLAELDIAERRVPQDGRFKVKVKGHDVDFRVSIMPSIFGEDAVLRILDKRAVSDEFRGLRLDTLGYDVATATILRRLAREPYGMLLVTGPTGSGKTTTLYAIISETHNSRDKIITIEDPVEYQLPGVLQIPVNEKKGLTFARGLRSILRHDPDKILVGEMRDPETAQIAVQSALTGHLVFTTVHANNVVDVISRFLHMGLDPYSFVSALNGVVAQRLLRINCPDCREPFTPGTELLSDSALTAADIADYTLLAGRGCGTCRGTGYQGRKAIAETLLMTDTIRELILNRAPARAIREAAVKQGTRDLRGAALDMVRRGETTLEEVNRVTFVG